MTQPDTQYGLEIPYDKSVEELVQLIREKPPLCWTAYTALAYNKSEKSIQALADLLKGSDWTHVRSAIEAIGNNANGIQLQDKLIGFLESTNTFIVTAAINALSQLKSLKAHDRIKTLANSDKFEIRQAAIEGLSSIWQVADFDFLINLNNQEQSDTIKKAIGFVLAEHVNKNNWKKFFNNFSQDTIPRHREWTLLFAMQFSNDLALIQQFRNDSDGHIRKKATQFLETTKSS